MADVVVVGAGIVGSSIAFHLARAGVAVTLIDQGPSPAAGVTGGSFAWIGDSGYGWPGGAAHLRGSVLADHRRLEAELPGVPVRRTGALVLGASPPDGGGDDPGPGRRWVGRDEIAALEPNLKSPPERALFSPDDAGVDAVRLTRALVRAAQELGARVVLGSTVSYLRRAGAGVDGVVTSSGFHPASTVVLATGTGTPALCAPLGVDLPVAASPAFLIRAAAPQGLVRTVFAGPRFEAREDHDGNLLMTAPVAPRIPEEELARRAVGRLRSEFGGGDAVRLLGYALSRRPMPPDGPLVGPATPDRSVYVAVMHSAVTLAPTAGRLVAEELVGGGPAPELARCRPVVGPM